MSDLNGYQLQNAQQQMAMMQQMQQLGLLSGQQGMQVTPDYWNRLGPPGLYHVLQPYQIVPTPPAPAPSELTWLRRRVAELCWKSPLEAA